MLNSHSEFVCFVLFWPICWRCQQQKASDWSSCSWLTAFDRDAVHSSALQLHCHRHHHHVRSGALWWRPCPSRWRCMSAPQPPPGPCSARAVAAAASCPTPKATDGIAGRPTCQKAVAAPPSVWRSDCVCVFGWLGKENRLLTRQNNKCGRATTILVDTSYY